MRDSLVLSAVAIKIEQSEFRGALRAYEGDNAFQALKEQSDLYVYRHRGRPKDAEVLVVPRHEAAKIEGPPLEALPVQEHLPGIARLVEHRLVDLLPKLKLRRIRWGLERIRRKDDLIDAAFEHLGRVRLDKLAGFHRFHRTVFRVRCEHVAGRGASLMMTVEFRRHQEIIATVAELIQRGFQLRGLDVFETEDVGSRRWLGRIVRAEEGRVVLHDGSCETTINGQAQYVESSSDTFASLFEQALGRELYERLRQAEWALRAKEVCGQGYVARLQQVADHLRSTGLLAIAPSIAISFGDIVPLTVSGRTPSAKQLPPVEYCFSWDRTAIDKYPASGLDKFGPFDGTTFDIKEPRLLVVCPEQARDDVDRFVRRLRDGMAADGKDRFARGLVGTYRLSRLATRFAPVVLGARGLVGQRYVDVLREQLGRERAPDVALIVVRDEDAFVEADNPYLAAKSFLLAQGIPSQEVRLSVMRTRTAGLPYILENIAVAIYAKLGGCPWTIRPTPPLTKEVIIGMAHAQFGGRYSPLRRVMGITTVFSSDGTYLLAAGSPRCEYEKYPETLAASVRDTLGRLAKEQGWTSGDVVRLVFHAPKPLTGNEVDTIAKIAIRTLGDGIQFESAFMTIETDHPLKVIAPQERGKEVFVERLDGSSGKARVGECAPQRGLAIDLGRSKRLLCVNGPLLIKREGESIPQPLQITLHKSSTYADMTALTRQVFQFTGLSWRSMLPVTEPVTIFYPRLIAKLLVRLSTLPGWSDDLLDTRLRRSRWFL
ncbi:Piwi domain-containing protein [Sorangium sp. So ce1504]|uniref:Piwi domain-containing protein n=1 Tax=Sorangium sp. So ce1504 TaxID=3133337 RepID=UPI003F5E4585